LHLPQLAQDERLRYITARAEPNPSVSGKYCRSRKPFHPSAEGAIIVFHVFALAMRSLLFIHRHALLTLLAAHPTGSTFPYAKWGPDICRWIPANDICVDWITTTTGQRCVLVPLRDWPTGQTALFMLDFNMSSDRQHHTYAYVLDPQDETFANADVWAESVASRLECTLLRSNEKYKYDGASLDAERIIGFRVR
jgi:hypothetical protein